MLFRFTASFDGRPGIAPAYVPVVEYGFLYGYGVPLGERVLVYGAAGLGAVQNVYREAPSRTIRIGLPMEIGLEYRLSRSLALEMTAYSSVNPLRHVGGVLLGVVWTAESFEI